MRNLKKVLSMVLAVSMMLSMMVFAGAAETKTEAPVADKKIVASDLTDMAKVENKEAVSLLVDLGIINGIKGADGTYTYAPTDGINRAAYSKMIYAMMLNKSNADVYKGTDTGLKDVKGHWAEGFIAYCVSTEIAAGDTDKNFKPDEAIKTVTGAKMLLTALGYDAKLSKYENDKLWSINIMKDAQEAGLLDGITLGADEILTRDVAALMIFNAINATTVTADVDRDQGVTYLKKYDHSAKTLGEQVFSLLSVKTTATSIDKNGVINLATSAIAAEKAAIDAANKAKLKGTADMVGNTVVIYAKAPFTINAATGTRVYTYKSLYSTAVVPAPATVIGTSMNGTAWGKLVDTTAKKFIAEVDSLTAYYFNGELVSDPAKIATAQGKVAKVGVIVEFLDTKPDTTNADVVKITEKTVAEVTDKVLTKTDSKGVVTVKVPGISATSAYVNCVGYENLVKGDIVLYVVTGGVVTIEKAKSVDGQISAIKTDSDGNVTYIVDGTAYSKSGLTLTKSSDTVNALDAAAKNKDSKLFLDNNGTVVAVLLVDETETLTNYSVITEIALTSTTGLNSTTNTDAILLHSDGTSEQVKVVSIDGFKTIAAGSTVKDNGKTATISGSTVTILSGNNTSSTVGEKFYALKAGKTQGSTTAADYEPLSIRVAGNVVANAGLSDIFYTYKTNKDGALALTTVADANKVVVADLNADGKIFPGKAVFATGFVGNSETVFVQKSTDAKGVVTYKSVTGIANAPKFDGTSTYKATGTVVSTDGIATIVYINNAQVAQSSTKSNPVYILDYETYTAYDAVTGKHDAYRMYDAIIDGAKGTVKATCAVSANGLYNAEIDADGYVTALTAAAEGNVTMGNVQVYLSTNLTNLGTSAAKGGVVGFGAHRFTYADDVAVYVIDGTDVSVGGIELVASDKTDAFAAVMLAGAGNDKDVLGSLYIVKKGALAPTAADLTKATGSGTVANGNLLVQSSSAKAAITGAATTDTYTVTVPSIAGQTVTVTIAGKGTTATTTVTGAGSVTATYALAAAKADANFKVTITVVMDGEDNWTKSYTVPVTYA